MPEVITSKNDLTLAQMDLTREKLNELEKSDKKLRAELMKLSNKGFSAVYQEMKKRGILS